MIERLWILFSRYLNRIPDLYFNIEYNRKIIKKIMKKVFKENELSEDPSLMSNEELLKRSYAQYLCQREIQNIWLKLIRTTGSLLILIPIILIFLFRNIKNENPNREKIELVILYYYTARKNLIPDELLKREPKLINQEKCQLSFNDIVIIIKLFMLYPIVLFQPEFILKIFVSIGIYSFIIKKYSPEEIVNFLEHSYSASVLTWYCKTHEVLHSNLMHGDRRYIAGQAFVTFKYFYTWGPYYKNLFNSLHAPNKQFIVLGNPIHQKLFWGNQKIKNQGQVSKCLLIFYEEIMTPNNDYFDLLLQLIDQLQDDWKIMVRIRYPQRHSINIGMKFVNKLKRILEERKKILYIEDASQVDIITSLENINIAAGVYSTALMDAWVSGKKVIRLLSSRHKFNIPEIPYFISKNVLTYYGNTKIDDFVNTPFYENDKDRNIALELSCQ
ncbi:MAG: hypothetical protein ACYC2T_06305 [Bacillota bacterium]